MGGEDDELKGLLGLPEEETELDVIPVYLIILSLGTLVFAVCVCSLYLGMSMTQQQEIFLSPVTGLCHLSSIVWPAVTYFEELCCVDLVMYDQG